MTNGGILDVGLLITAVFATIGYFYRTGVARRGAARTLLFHLLEIRHELTVETPELDRTIDEFRSEMHQLVGERPHLRSLVVDAIPKTQIAAMLTQVNANLIRADQALLESYDAALFDYSSVDPVLTHKIRGMKLLPVLSSNFSDAKTSFAVMMDGFEGGEKVKKHGQNEIDRSLEDTFHELMSALDNNICKLSQKAGTFIWLRTRKILKRTSQPENCVELTADDIAKMMESLFKSIILDSDLTYEHRVQVEAASLEEIMDFFERKLTEDSS